MLIVKPLTLQRLTVLQLYVLTRVLGHNSVNVQSKLNLNITVLLQQSVGFIIFCFLLFKQTLNLSSLHASTTAKLKSMESNPIYQKQPIMPKSR